MPSVMVSWEGRCADAGRRDALTRRLMQLGRLSHSLFDPPLPLRRAGPTIAGNIVVWEPHFLGEGARGTAGKFLTLPELAVEGVDFRLFDAREIYRGDDRISFVFATLPGHPETAGTIVQIEPKERCVRYDQPEIQAADYFVKPAGIHLRYYCEAWIDGLLGWIKRYFVDDLDYWRQETLSGYARFAGLDPADEARRDRLWHGIVADFAKEARSWLGQGRELRAWLDHINRSGVMPASWAFEPYSPLDTQLHLAPGLAALLPEESDKAALRAACRLAILRARKGFDLHYLSFRFRELTIALSSQLIDDRHLVIDTDLAPNDRLRAIARDEVIGRG